MFYMDVRYEGAENRVNCPASEPDLVLTNRIELIKRGSTHMGLACDLVDWHEQDPVDARDVWRNEVVYDSQGNRNPFIDHPEWVRSIWWQCGRHLTIRLPSLAR
jgi:endonuclease I